MIEELALGGLRVDRRRTHGQTCLRKASAEEVAAAIKFWRQRGDPVPDDLAEATEFYYVCYVCAVCAEKMGGIVRAGEQFGTTCECYRRLKSYPGGRSFGSPEEKR
jgi:hypothetical protein